MPGMQPLDSRSLAALGYDAARRELHVRFRDSGDAYAYEGVPPAVYEQMLAAESRGKFLNEHIKGRYPYRRL